MKNFLLLFFVCSTQCFFAQNNELKNKKARPYSIEKDFEVVATFPTGEENFRKYVTENLKLPEMEGKISGEIIMSFTIGVDGFLTDITLVKNTLGNYGELISIDAVRALRSCPKWNPATIGGKPVRMEQKIPLKITNP